MKNRWDNRVYVELNAGAGYSRIRGTTRVIRGSPLLALGVKDPFDRYVFCEENPEKIDALKLRVRKFAPDANVEYVTGDCDKNTAEILAKIPVGSRSDTVLSLCFADPFDISLKFDTLRNLASRYMDFVVLLAVYSDANRAYKRYVMEDAVKVDEFLDPLIGENVGELQKQREHPSRSFWQRNSRRGWKRWATYRLQYTK
jgi:three-Cys-motif partner protein